jgi:hypothetical protein
MDGVQSPNLYGLGLRRAIENQGIQFDQLQRIEQLQDDCPPTGHFCVGKSSSRPQTVQSPETLHSGQNAGDATVNLAPFGECVSLAQRYAQ